MLTYKKLKVLEVWRNNIFKELVISEIMSLLKKNTKTWVFNTIKELTNKNLLNVAKKGNINIYNLNLNNPLSTQFLQYLENLDNINFPKINLISEIIEAIELKTYCLIVFGSYAEKKQNIDSDIDLCFLIENKILEKEIKPYLNEIKLNHTIKIDDHYITFEDMVKMLLKKEENLGKQIFRKHKLFYNNDLYYNLIKEAYKNGFR